MCTEEVQLNTGLTFGKTSECTHKRSNSQHGIGSWARLPNVHTRGPTQHGVDISKDFRMCTQEVQHSTRNRQFGKTSEYEHKRSNSQHGIAESAKLPNVHTRCPTLNTGKAVVRLPNVHTRGPTLNRLYPIR
ncbi:hypothetical protein PoB_001076800 [Plakobranchus ocellatus]|uniref:Uncharacterized protein n=1 Tax=Plakobranchus ocellatus TaxID=259542 RepID=A0AAV3YPT1_9GAST|nr:hypothetical protein PoB_001076800 [Plakobranchus ocellatus]